MSLETGTYISDLVVTNPTSSDPKSQGDDHIRLVKSAVKATFPNVAGAVTPTHAELNYVGGVTSAIQTQINAKGAIAGQAWTGSHTFPTQAIGDNSTKAATTEYVMGVTSAWSTVPTHAAASKATPVDADEFGLLDSAASFTLKKLTWANLKAAVKTYFDTLYATIAQATSAVTISGGTINGTPIGGTTPAAGTFTSVMATTASDSITAQIRGGVNALLVYGDYMSGGVRKTVVQALTLNGAAYVPLRLEASVFEIGNGNVLIGTTTDDGVSKLQVNGGIATQSINFGALQSGAVALKLPRSDGNPGGFSIRVPSSNGTLLRWSSANDAVVYGYISGGGTSMGLGGIWSLDEGNDYRLVLNGTNGSGNALLKLSQPSSGAHSNMLDVTTYAGASVFRVTGTGTVTASETISTGGYTVATLPAAGTAGRRAYVTDATAPTFLGALTGGGAVKCPVFDNGVAWVAG